MLQHEKYIILCRYVELYSWSFSNWTYVCSNSYLTPSFFSSWFDVSEVSPSISSFWSVNRIVHPRIEHREGWMWKSKLLDALQNLLRLWCDPTLLYFCAAMPVPLGSLLEPHVVRNLRQRFSAKLPWKIVYIRNRSQRDEIYLALHSKERIHSLVVTRQQSLACTLSGSACIGHRHVFQGTTRVVDIGKHSSEETERESRQLVLSQRRRSYSCTFAESLGQIYKISSAILALYYQMSAIFAEMLHNFLHSKAQFGKKHF